MPDGAMLAAAAFDPSRPGPLAGIRVIDMSRLVAGNMLSLQLGDFGADVIKVEAAGSGDTLRQWSEKTAGDPEGFDGWWQVYGRNKRSLALDLRSGAARDLLLRLAADAQVLIESFRPGTLEKMGLSPAVLHERNPRLVVVRLSGWGQTGPYRELPGFGSLIEGFSGFAQKNGFADKPPLLPGMALADMIAGLTGAFATLAALREVEAGKASGQGSGQGGGQEDGRGNAGGNGRGNGQVIDLSLLESMLAIMGPDAAVFSATGVLPKREAKIASPRGVYRCRDGRWISMSGSTDRMARRVFDAIGRGELFDDPRFSTNAARLENDAEVDGMVAQFVARLDMEPCLALFREKGVTVGPVHDVEQLLADPHVVARQAYVSVAREGGRPAVVMHNVSPRLSGTPGGLRRPAPRRGQHSTEILAEIGIDAAQLGALVRAGAIECG